MHTEVLSAFLVLFILAQKLLHINAYRVIDVDGVDTILAMENEKISIECKVDVPISYCGFVHPTGKRYSFTGPELSLGKCWIKIDATTNDTGEWRCHIGKSAIGVETMKRSHVRLVSQVAAIRPNITATHGEPITLECITTKRMRPTSYCRFEPPYGVPFSINGAVNDSKPILNKYFYPQNKSIDRGDCAVTIRKVSYEDVGVWTCGAGLDDGKEYTDRIEIQVEGLYTLSTASVTGITFGAVAIAVILCILGVIVWKKRAFLGSPSQPVDQGHELEPRPPTLQSQRTPEPSPLPRHVPSVVVQSPSEPGSSPLML